MSTLSEFEQKMTLFIQGFKDNFNHEKVSVETAAKLREQCLDAMKVLQKMHYTDYSESSRKWEAEMGDLYHICNDQILYREVMDTLPKKGTLHRVDVDRVSQSIQHVFEGSSEFFKHRKNFAHWNGKVVPILTFLISESDRFPESEQIMLAIGCVSKYSILTE